jgi:hypothetical protein
MSKPSIQKQLFRSHLSSVVISVLLNAGLLFLLLTFITFSDPQRETDTAIKIIEAADKVDIQEIEELIPPEEVDPSDMTEDMSLDMSEMINQQLDTSVPEEQTAIASPVVSPVIMEGLAQALGGVSLEGLGDGTKRTTRFMGQSGEGNRFAFVIDYSRSMSPLQLRVMKHELTTALAAIGEQGLATLLFFSGPVWRPDQDAIAAEDWWTGSNGRRWVLKQDAEPPNPQWLVPDRKNMAALRRMIYQTPTTFGTDWYPPLKEALEIRPRPDILFFMTDGRSSASSAERAIELAKSLPRGEIIINTVALGINEEDAAPLKELAEITGGNFRRYGNEELREVAEGLPEPPDEFSDADLTYLSLTEVRNREARARNPRRPPPEEKDVVTFEID